MALREVLQNAVDAMPDGGRLRVHLRNRRVTGDPGDLADGPYVEVEVEDSGPGIPPHEVPRAFDPFYSTKPRDRARGLGLSIAFGILRRHRGDIRIASAPGAGTTVTVLIPADPGA
jgi:signal transduction histidine kinase